MFQPRLETWASPPIPVPVCSSKGPQHMRWENDFHVSILNRETGKQAFTVLPFVILERLTKVNFSLMLVTFFRHCGQYDEVL